jgi:hypothetical protein
VAAAWPASNAAVGIILLNILQGFVKLEVTRNRGKGKGTRNTAGT